MFLRKSVINRLPTCLHTETPLLSVNPRGRYSSCELEPSDIAGFLISSSKSSGYKLCLGAHYPLIPATIKSVPQFPTFPS